MRLKLSQSLLLCRCRGSCKLGSGLSHSQHSQPQFFLLGFVSILTLNKISMTTIIDDDVGNTTTTNMPALIEDNGQFSGLWYLPVVIFPKKFARLEMEEVD